MHAALISLLGTAALASAPPPATSVAPPTPAAHAHRCAPSQPSFTSLLASAGVRCREARALNTYMTRHETLSKAFRFGGERWRGTVYSRARGRTAMLYRHRGERVWITYGGEAS